jgi:2-amino-4-hydroxy-6-hydroxymethyldihydropteridine diphosphokinase
MRINQAYILIGSNINKKTNYPKALRRLSAIGKIGALSSVYETAPIGNKGHSYYNGAVLLETELNPFALKRALRIIESQLGRVRTSDAYAPRTIDLDVVLFNHDIINDENLNIPSPQIWEQPFVALPLAEISPDYVVPIKGERLTHIARRFGNHPTGIRIEPTATARAKQIATHNFTGAMIHA